MGKPNLMRATIITPGTVEFNQTAIRLALFDSAGAALMAPKEIAAQTDVGAVTSTVAAGANPTKAEFDALRVDALAIRTVLNSLLAKMRTADILAE